MEGGGGVTLNWYEGEWEYCQRDCLHTIILLTGRGGVDTKFWLGVGILTKKWGGGLTLNCGGGGGVGVGILSKRLSTHNLFDYRSRGGDTKFWLGLG